MTGSEDVCRPPVDPGMSADEFDRWYWSVADLDAFCTLLDLSKSGRRAERRDRVLQHLRGEPAASLAPRSSRAKGSFNWSKATLTRDTEITDSISFGPNVRGFFRDQIGAKFVCHSDFMDWVKANPGETLADAIDAWWALEARKDDPGFRREIASCNTYLRYLRDIRDAHPKLPMDAAKTCWDHKKLRPAPGGEVIYEPDDLKFLG